MRAVEGAEDAEGMGVRGERMQPRSPGSPGWARTPIIIRWTLRRLEHASIIWWIGEGRIFPLCHPASACILCRTSNCTIHHTRTIFAVIMSGYARSTLLPPVPPPSPCILAICVHLFGSLERNLLIAKVQAHQREGQKREKEKERGGGIYWFFWSTY